MGVVVQIKSVNPTMPPKVATPKIQVIKKSNDKEKTFLDREGERIAQCVGTVALKVSGLLNFIGHSFYEITKICPAELMSRPAISFIEKKLDVDVWILECLGIRKSYFWAGCVFAPIYEELECRYLLQELLMKKLPEKILQKYRPQSIKLVNHPAAVAARIFTSSLWFAASHLHSHDCSKHGGALYAHFLAGLLFGKLQEDTGHSIYNIIAHAAINTCVGFILKKL